jgi:hypothetical protein
VTLHFSPERIAVGASLIGVGALDILSRMGRVEFLTALRTWWPTTLVVWGAAELIKTLAARAGSPR